MEDSLLCTNLRLIGYVLCLSITPVFLLKPQTNIVAYILNLGAKLTGFWSENHSKELFTICV